MHVNVFSPEIIEFIYLFFYLEHLNPTMVAMFCFILFCVKIYFICFGCDTPKMAVV